MGSSISERYRELGLTAQEHDTTAGWVAAQEIMLRGRFYLIEMADEIDRLTEILDVAEVPH